MPKNFTAIKTEINTTIKVLKNGGIILYPTDTVWGIGCDAQNSDAIKKIYALKQRAETKSMICLVSNLTMLKRYINEIPEAAVSILKTALRPTTIIYNNPKFLAENIIAEDNTIAIRIPNEDFCQQLLKAYDGAIVSTSANISGLPTPQCFNEISEDIIKGVDYVVNLHKEKTNTNPSKIIKVNSDGSLKIIRE